MLAIVFQHGVRVGSRPPWKVGMFRGGRLIDGSTGRRDRRGIDEQGGREKEGRSS